MYLPRCCCCFALALPWLPGVEADGDGGSPAVSDGQAADGETITIEADRGAGRRPLYQDSETWFHDAPQQTRLTVDEALEMPGVFGDPIRAITYLPGVQTLDGELSLHASKPQESQYSINHLPIGYLFHMGGLYSVLPETSISQLDIYLGGFDATYGNATGGVVDVTPSPLPEKNRGFVSVGILQTTLAGEFTLDENWSLKVGARRSYFDFILPKTGELGDDVTYDRFPRFWDASLSLGYRRGSHQFSFETLAAGDELRINTQEDAVKDPEATGTVAARWGFVSSGLRWRYDGGDGYRAHTLIGHMREQLRLDLFDDYHVDIDQDLSTLYHNSQWELGRHRLDTGLEYQYYRAPLDLVVKDPGPEDQIDFDFTTAPDLIVDETVSFGVYSPFLQDTIAFSPMLSARVGLRGEFSDHDGFDQRLLPRGALVFTPNDWLTLSASVGQYSRRSDLIAYVDELGSERIVDERADHYSCKLIIDTPVYGQFSVEPYYKDLSHLVLVDDSGQYSNSGSGESLGVAFEYRINAGDWQLLASYVYEEAERQLNADDDRRYPFYNDTPHTLQFGGTWYISERWSLGALARYHSGQIYTPVVGAYEVTNTDGSTRYRPIYGEPYSERLPSFFILNLKAVYSRPLQSGNELELAFELFNATNHRNVSEIDYSDDYTTSDWADQLPVIPSVSLGYRW